MAKLLENVFRNVNIAFVNQLALLCERMGLDVWEVIDAAATKPFGFMRFTPGPGVGGHCIPVDPYYLSWRAREFDFVDRFIELAGDINLAMPRHVVDLVAEALNDRGRAIRGGKVGVVGVAFKPNVQDDRNSPAADVIAGIASRGGDVRFHDPHVARFRDGDGVVRDGRRPCGPDRVGGRDRRRDGPPLGRLGRALRHRAARRRHGELVRRAPRGRSAGAQARRRLVGDGSRGGATGPTVSEHQREPGARPRIAYLSYSTGEFDARTFRMARSAVEAGWDVTVYARWHRGLAPIEQRDGYRLVRAPREWRYLVPGLRGIARRRYRAAMARTQPAGSATATTTATTAPAASTSGRSEPSPRTVRSFRFRPLERWHWWQRIREFPLQPMGWAIALDDVVEPADIWHGMWAGSLPALDRMRRRHGGRTIYDSRDIFMHSRKFARLGRPGRTLLERAERRWARRADRVLTVNDSYAELLERLLRVTRPRSS